MTAYIKDYWQHAAPFLNFASKVLAWLPVVLSLNLLALLVGVVVHPELLVVAAVRVLKFLPAYITYAVSRMMTQVAWELNLHNVVAGPWESLT
eukprot:12330560-Karenia_brevis.AAC.1